MQTPFDSLQCLPLVSAVHLLLSRFGTVAPTRLFSHLNHDVGDLRTNTISTPRLIPHFELFEFTCYQKLSITGNMERW